MHENVTNSISEVEVAQRTMIQASLFASDLEMYVGICLGDVSVTRKQYITNESRVITHANELFHVFDDLTENNCRSVCRLVSKASFAEICSYCSLFSNKAGFIIKLNRWCVLVTGRSMG